MRLLVVAICAAFACKPAPAPTAPPISNATPTRAERLAVVIAIDDGEIWNGNDQIEPELTDQGAPNPAHYPGALNGIHAALAKRSLAEAAPGALGALVAYSSGARLRVPMGPIAKLDASAFGTHRSHYQKIGNDLVEALELATDELERTQAERKLLLVVGDGNDTNFETAIPKLRALRDRLDRRDRSNIRVRAIVWKSPISVEEMTLVTRLTDDVVIVKDANMVGLAIVEAIAAAARSR